MGPGSCKITRIITVSWLCPSMASPCSSLGLFFHALSRLCPQAWAVTPCSWNRHLSRSAVSSVPNSVYEKKIFGLDLFGSTLVTHRPDWEPLLWKGRAAQITLREDKMNTSNSKPLSDASWYLRADVYNSGRDRWLIDIDG